MQLGRRPDVLSGFQIEAKTRGSHTGRSDINAIALHGRPGVPPQSHRKLPGQFTSLRTGRLGVTRVVLIPLEHRPFGRHVPALRKRGRIAGERLIDRTFFLEGLKDLLSDPISFIDHLADFFQRFGLDCTLTLENPVL